MKRCTAVWGASTLLVVIGCISDPPAVAGSGDADCEVGCEEEGTSSIPTGSETSIDPETGGESGDAGGPSGLPCDVAEVLAASCSMCHGDPPKFGAPMSLTSHADFQMPAVTDLTRAVHALVGERIDDPDAPMPPGGDMSEADKDVLRSWVAAGAPASADDCEVNPDGTPEVGPDALPCEPAHVFTAHAPGSDDGFVVPAVDDLYQCFTFSAHLAAGTQATAWAPIVDDDRVLHHWILYRTKEPQTDGGVMPCQMPSDARFVAGWAPGGTNYVMPDDVGLELGGPDDSFILQVHYNNTAGYADAIDGSGVALCEAETPREQEAGIFTLGSLAINIPAGAERHTVEGTCPSWMTSVLPAPVHILASFPHMHQLGRRLTTDILRGGLESATETLVDVDPFQFQNQRYYPHEPEVLIHPGDALRTRCVYDNPNDHAVFLGEGTGDEMCFNFVMLYPLDIVGETRECGLF
jgi:hypothetical protein